MDKLFNSDKSVVFGGMANYLTIDTDGDLVKERENRMGMAKVFEYLTAIAVNGTVANKVGYDIIVGNTKVEVKSTWDKFLRKNGEFKSKNIIITNKFGINNIIDVKSDIFMFHSLYDKLTVIADAKDIEKYITVSGRQLLFNIQNINNCKHTIIKWNTGYTMSRKCFREIYKEANALVTNIDHIKNTVEKDIR